MKDRGLLFAKAIGLAAILLIVFGLVSVLITQPR